MTDSNVEIVKGAYEAFGRGDVEAVLGAMSEDVEWNEAEGMPYGGRHIGRQAVAERVFGPIVADIPNLSVTPEEMYASGDTVVVVTRYAGTGAATGVQLDLPVVHIWDIRDGQLARFRQFADTIEFAEVVPAETPARA
jgi:uncharacterized protein